MSKDSDSTDLIIAEIVASIRASKKYHSTHEATILEFVRQAYGKYRSRKETDKAVRRRLHKLMAPYVGDPNYTDAAEELQSAFAAPDPQTVRAACTHILSAHFSTQERLPLLNRFYHEIFAVTGRPQALLDLACGVNPLTFPWMDLPVTGTRFYAYDVHEERVAFLNTYFTLQGLPQLAILQDIAFSFPQEPGDVALFLKELPRFEQTYPGKGLELMEALRVRWLVVSFPVKSLHGGRSLEARYRQFFTGLMAGKPWPLTELAFESELVFCVDKGSG